MFLIKDTLISSEILKQEFVCNLAKCKGACCVEGESGAPLEPEEKQYLQENFKTIKPFLTQEGIKAIAKQGTSIIDSDGDCVTPLVEGKECAYTIFLENGTASCGIEKAYEEGAIDFQKPISCYLYPIRVEKIQEQTVLNFHEWKICHAACDFGKELKVDLVDFLEKPLVRKFGDEWYDELKEVKKLFDESNQK